MTGHWRIALRCSVWMVLIAIPLVVAVYYGYGEAHALAFCYGVAVGILSFVSTAVTVSLLTGGSRVAGVLLGAGSFGLRYGFAALALGVPAYLGLWPVVAMLVGFAGVYFAETIMLVPWAVRTMRIPVSDAPEAEIVERRTEV